MVILDIIVLTALSVAAGCGLGGGGLVVVYLTLAKGTDQIVAQALNLLFYILAALASTVAGRQKTNKSLIRSAVFCSLIALPGAYLGSHLRSSVSDTGLRIVFGIFLITAGITVGLSSMKKLTKSKADEKKPES